MGRAPNMKRDPLFFRLFKELPGCFFHLVGRPEEDANRYDLASIEYKETSVRLDGVFLPRQPVVDPAYLWEVQYYASDKVYANLLSKIGRFLEHGDPAQDWVAVVIYPSRSLEQTSVRPYRWLIDSDQLLRVYLDELPPAPADNIELGVLELITAKPEAALARAQVMVPQVRTSTQSSAIRDFLLKFIATVIMYQFPRCSREEVEKMIAVTDFRQTRVYQEALDEGKEEGRKEAIEKVARRLLDQKLPIAEIAAATELTPAQIKKLKKKAT